MLIILTIYKFNDVVKGLTALDLKVFNQVFNTIQHISTYFNTFRERITQKGRESHSLVLSKSPTCLSILPKKQRHMKPGLSAQEALQRLMNNGTSEIPVAKSSGMFRILKEVLTS